MTKREEQMLAFLDKEEALNLIQDLINARSDYPPGDTRRVCQVCQEKLSQWGIENWLEIPDDTVRNPKDENPSSWYPSVIGKIEGDGNGPVLLLNAHIDTVSAGDLEEWKTDPFKAEVKDGKVYGRGSGDDKGSVCAQLLAASLIKRAGIPLKGTLVLNPVSDEEANSCRGAKWLRDSGRLKPDMVIVGEQTNNEIAVAERAVVFVKITITGRGCHGAMPWAGSNATVHMSRFIQRLETELIPAVQQVKHPYLPLTTLSATHIEGGYQVNIIPEVCTLEIDCRLVPGVEEKFVLSEFDRILSELSCGHKEFQYRIEVTNSENGVITDTGPDTDLIQALAGAWSQVRGTVPEFTGYRQASDGRVFAKLNIPVAIFGPGDPALGHAPNEFVPMDQIVEAAKILALTIVKLLA